MGNGKKFEKVDVSKLSKAQQQARVNRMAYIACCLAVVGLPSSLLGFGMFLAIAGLVIAVKAEDPDGKRPIISVVAIGIAILDILLSVVGWIVLYGTYVNPNSEFVQKLVDSIFGAHGIITLF